ncbi:sulfate adenylyltransferase subunit CysN [Cohaesibacter celericrescens]|uniref:Multifunctional fusion protein n=1 Tax=Cohaesibacter celericrescens TaxID=2067669 RepID=A0A2N5XTI1_9HYPH|nr:sulfate adenylyltransferase subunit CysN [Cohaesibacter celericrescens]PLW77757.1 adenylyl-sulfate kinase [Cohaesibacter celericrescens]
MTIVTEPKQVSSAVATKGDSFGHEQSRDLLRFLTCGSVDDGKSTLIGRLLYDSKTIFEDQMTALEAVSKKHGTVGDEVDLALLLDGLQAEQEQGITIDVAYRFFASEKRKFIVADTPGHEQYTRNMATGASNCDLAVILVDARKGILTQTRRHSFINSLIGVRHVVLAINKMDLMDFDQEVFDTIVADYKDFAQSFEFETIAAVPLSARFGDNVVTRSDNTPWYDGPTLLGYLEEIDVESADLALPFRFPVQWVNRPNLNFRGFSGTVASGLARVGDELVVAKSGKTSRIKSIVTMDGDQEDTEAGEAVTITLEDEIDISRGDLLAPSAHRPLVTDQISAHLIWMDSTHLLLGRPYIIKMGSQQVQTTVTSLKHKLDVNDASHLTAGKTLELNEIGFCNMAFAEPLAMDTYEENQKTGSFILIDRFTNQTVAAGLVWFGLRRAENIHWQAVDVDKGARAEQKHQKPKVLWFTGLSGSGKSTIANLVEKKLHGDGRHTYLLDGDNVRHGLNKDLGFTDVDRVENIRRIGEVSRLMVDAGLIVLTAFISPYASERRLAREMLEEGEFIEVFVDTPLEICEQRDVKGLYAKARQGKIKNFTGIDAPYEAPLNPEIHVNTSTMTAQDAAERIVDLLSRDDVYDWSI